LACVIAVAGIAATVPRDRAVGRQRRGRAERQRRARVTGFSRAR
jgi:hypothetical protein